MTDFKRFDHLSNTSFDEAVLEDITVGIILDDYNDQLAEATFSITDDFLFMEAVDTICEID